MIPPPQIDIRIARLRRQFGTRTFTTHQAASVLHMSVQATWHLLFHGEGLYDEVSRVAMHNADWVLLTRNPEEILAERTAQQYRDLLRRQESWSAQEFADAAAIPFPTSNYLLSLMVRFGKIDLPPHSERFHVQRRRVRWG